jgi:pimeloyl-ACP methyl ester carboxylesterase
MPEADDYGNPNPDWLKVEWRRHLRRVSLPGAEVNYVEIGEGEPILFVHGLSGSWQNWLENLPRFGRRRRAIALDLPGFGQSPMPSWPIEMRAYGQLLHDFCEKIGVERGATLVGNSMGGLVACEAVLSGPSRFDRLVFVSTAGLMKPRLPRLTGGAAAAAWRTFVPDGLRATRAVVRNRLVRYLSFRTLVRYPNRLRRELLWEQAASGLPAPGFADAMRAEIEYDPRERLREIGIPTLIVWGFDDLMVSAAGVLTYHRLIAGSQLEVFERTGHLPQLERPARFNRLLEEFAAA